MHRPIEGELGRALHGVTAPPELWNRITSNQVRRSSIGDRRLVWAMAAIVVLAAVGLSLVRSRDNALAAQAQAGDPQLLAFHCQNPAELRAWVQASSGLEAPTRSKPPISIQLMGAVQAREGSQANCRLCHLD